MYCSFHVHGVFGFEASWRSFDGTTVGLIVAHGVVWEVVNSASRLLMGHISDESRFNHFDGPFGISYASQRNLPFFFFSKAFTY